MTRRILSMIGAVAMLGSGFGPSPAVAMSEVDKNDIKAVVREYILENPEVLVEAMDALEAKRASEEARARKKALAGVSADVLATPPGTALGNPNGDITVVEFFDYNCGYCKRGLGDMESLIESDPKLRFVLKEVPVLGDDSLQASHVSLAFRHVAPEQYGKFHERLLGLKGVANENSALSVAEELGVNEATIRAAMKRPEVDAAIEENNRISAALRINGTPTYVIGDEVVSGAIGRDALAAKIRNVRQCASTVC